MIKRIKDNQDDLKLLRYFLSSAGTSLSSFRYFDKRPLSVIKNHRITLLILEENEVPVAYGHLDPEKDIVWLGICVAKSASRKGHGSTIMNSLLNEAKERGIKEVYLKVDIENKKAISIYKKFFFETIIEEPNKYFIMKHIVINDN